MAAYVPIAAVPPSPPRLHWGWLLLLTVVTSGYFGIVWQMVQANWVRRVRGRSTALFLSIGYCAFFLMMFLVGVIFGLMRVPEDSVAMSLFAVTSRLGGFILLLCATYTLRSELQSEPIGLSLGGIMTFFFNVVYFQYFLHDYHLEEQSAGSRNPLSIT